MSGPDCRRDERGAVAVLVAIVLLVLGGFMALSLNVGHSRAVRGELQNAADAAALAGARELDGTMVPITNRLPHAQAVDFAGRHVTDKDVVVDIGQDDVILGHWDPFATDPATAFVPVTATNASQARQVNAVRVLTGREASRDNALEVFFGAAFLGNPARTNVRAEAVAVNGGPCNLGCPTAPLSFFDCGQLSEFARECKADSTFRMTVSMSSDPKDMVGLTNFTDSSSLAEMKNILSGDTCAPISSGEEIAVQNGEAGLTALCGANGNSESTFNYQFCHKDEAGNCTLYCPPGTCTTDPAVDPNIAVAPVVAVDDPTLCTTNDEGIASLKFNGAHEVVGFVTFRMVRLVCGNESKGEPSLMELEFVCNPKDAGNGRIGCGFFGTGPLQPKLVR